MIMKRGSDVFNSWNKVYLRLEMIFGFVRSVFLFVVVFFWSLVWSSWV